MHIYVFVCVSACGWVCCYCHNNIIKLLLFTLDMYVFRNQPYYSCPALNTSASTVYRELHLKNKNDCSTSIVGHVKEEYRQHGVVLVYLNKVCICISVSVSLCMCVRVSLCVC